jgi:hypothetical protein
MFLATLTRITYRIHENHMCSFVQCAQLANLVEIWYLINANHQNWVLLSTLAFCLVIVECPCQGRGVALKKGWFQRHSSWHWDNGAYRQNCGKIKGNLTPSYPLSWPYPVIPPTEFIRQHWFWRVSPWLWWCVESNIQFVCPFPCGQFTAPLSCSKSV